MLMNYRMKAKFVFAIYNLFLNIELNCDKEKSFLSTCCFQKKLFSSLTCFDLQNVFLKMVLKTGVLKIL